MTDPVFSGALTQPGNLIVAVGALGTAAFGLVDATKAWKSGGISNAGYSLLQRAMAPFLPALRAVYKADPMETIRANWINGVATADQKAAAKGLIRLGVTPGTSATLADATGVNAAALATAATNVETGGALTPADLNVLGRLDGLVSAILDAAYERADQRYRNGCKALALAFSVLMAWIAAIGIAVQSGGGSPLSDFLLATLIGVAATPLAPVAKDAASALQAVAAALSAAKP